VNVKACLGAGGESPFRHANPLIVDLHCRYGTRRCHRKSSGKYLRTDRKGLGAA